jgi:hypothetical protein
MKTEQPIRIIYISIRVLFFVSFFLPFLFLPECKGPSADEMAAKEQALSDSIRKSDSISQAYQGSMSDMSASKVKPDSAIATAKLPEENNQKRILKKDISVFSKIDDFLRYPTENSISGYGIAAASLHGGLNGFTLYAVLLSFLCSLAGIFMLFVRKNHIAQTIISVFSLLLLLMFFLIIADGKIPKDIFMWGFWTCLFLSFSNLLMTILIRRKRLRFQ